MNLAQISIKRPIFITCIFIVTLVVGLLSMSKMPVDLFPNITFPVVTVTTVYPGAGPKEVETLISKPIEDDVSSISGIKRLSSINRESVSVVVVEFDMKVDVKYAEQQVRDRISAIRSRLPSDAEDSVIRRIDPADQPILVMALKAKVPQAKLFDIADQIVKPRLENVNQVGLVEIVGGRKREIHVELDARKLKERELSASLVVSRVAATGKNIPAGKVDQASKEAVIRTVGEFQSLEEISRVGVSLFGNDVPVTVSQLGKVTDTLEDEKTRAFLNGESALMIRVFRQSGSNTIEVADGLLKRLDQINVDLKKAYGQEASLSLVQDMSRPIRANVADVYETILIGVALLIVVVLFFLGSVRSTFITSLALPNSILGAFVFMYLCGFTINVMTLLAISLAVGLLVDDAIVVRENIFRHVEMGKSAKRAALEGTNEVTLAVIATTAAVVAVFGPIGFLQGLVGQFFKEFGLTICFAMAFSLFDALTMAPMMSAYLGGAHGGESKNPIGRAMGRVLKAFDRFQTRLEDYYESTLTRGMRRPALILAGALAIFVASLVTTKFISKNFLPSQDNGEFAVDLDLPPGTTLEAMTGLAMKVDEQIRSNPEVDYAVLSVGTKEGEANKAGFYVRLVTSAKRQVNTAQMKAKIREQLKAFAMANPVVKDFDPVGAGQRPFNLNIVGTDLNAIQKVALELKDKLSKMPDLTDIDVSFRTGKPEYQFVPDKEQVRNLGVSSVMIGAELRTLVEGTIPAVFREDGREYDIRVRLQPDQRDLSKSQSLIYVPNMNNSLLRLQDVGRLEAQEGPSSIERQNRGRYVRVVADVAPNGRGMGAAIDEINRLFREEIKLPEGVSYSFAGQAENFQELMANMLLAIVLGVLFIYLVLASLYESFVTPFTIMLVLPLAICGAFFALVIAGASLNIFSMIGCVMLLGVATKNSILMVDYIRQMEERGVKRAQAIIEGSKTRLRPILMTSGALIAGMIPLAVGLNEASKQRTSMGIVVIGGLVSSTLLTLYVVPAAYDYIERFRAAMGRFFRRFGAADVHEKDEAVLVMNTEPESAKRPAALN